MVSLIVSYVQAVLRHGWWLLLALVGALGDLGTVVGTFNVPRPIWYTVIAFGILAAQFRAYADVTVQLAAVRARLRELDSVEAKRSFIDEALVSSSQFRAELEQLQEKGPTNNTDFRFVWDRICTDVDHWESELRRDLRQSFPNRTDLFFDSEDGLLREGERPGDAQTSPRFIRYLERREERLRQIKKDIS